MPLIYGPLTDTRAGLQLCATPAQPGGHAVTVPAGSGEDAARAANDDVIALVGRLDVLVSWAFP